jgi:hypothetical protein
VMVIVKPFEPFEQTSSASGGIEPGTEPLG